MQTPRYAAVPATTGPLGAAVRDLALPLEGAAYDYDALLALIGDARVVCLGEASHGTHEFYRERARITRRLAGRARFRYGCFEQFGEDTQACGYAAEFGITPSCEREAVAQLAELQRRAGELAGRDGRLPRDEYFFAEQNARVVRNAEEYYRTMFRGRVSS
jgi:erythromycin esterase-like protein